MADFFSKLQYKTYEKGEFSGEKVRNLEDTLKLIRHFPWDEQRGVDIQLTGPSVTIQDEYVNYLKVSLYFNGKFCLYYLDNDNHLYELPAPDLDTACNLVTNFFEKQLDINLFEKHLFNIGNQGHFVTNHFEYRVKLWQLIMSLGLLFILIIMLTILDIILVRKDEFVYPSLIFVVASIVIYYLLFKTIRSIMINRNNYLHISKGNDVFEFGYNEEDCKKYNKDDISKVIVFESKGKRDPGSLANFEIVFKDGSFIKFSSLLISKYDLINKFQEELIVYDYQRRFQRF